MSPDATAARSTADRALRWRHAVALRTERAQPGRLRKLDIAFITEPVDDAALTCVPVSSYALGWVAGTTLKLPRGRLPLSTVAEWPIITHLRHPRTYGSVQDLLVRAGRPDARVYTSSSISTMTVAMILNGIGVGTIPIAAVARELRERKVRLLDVTDAALPPYDFVAAYPRDSQTHITAAVAAIAREVAHHGARPIRCRGRA
jgi:DNA-binding transcriptional LysR family regulator